MTMLVYERIEDFLEKLGTLEKTTAVYVTVVHAKQNEMHVASIRLQYCDENCLFHTFNYGEGIHPVRMIPLEVFDLIPDDKMRKDAQADYDAEIDAFNSSVKAEYEKAKNVFIKMGYANIVNAYSV